ncbi:hypothetical protein [Mesorhizobium sp.]|uniref:hypothetical protein n=1 Tax=Mesorhizobium sp. TaxID=1871066 RepID=UPI000FE2CBD2|nr:hypothetical protein [Mesorhizobium sp.]RWI35422.1 MAG: hypothetical protein EOR14_28375 [Mesorhizobium sp.]RWJ03520.1 MAG: hypothetical protein EOR24_32600 [Mesorhizobium sp.]RWJ66409.1 MAG: hypothetical protein EOR34_28760 [Mesorhizobium sp.]
MIFDQLSGYADSAAVRYGMLTDSWRSLFQNALNSSRFGAPAQASDVVREAYQIAESFLDEEREHAERVTTSVALEALQTTLAELESSDATKLTDAALQHLQATQSYIIDELVAQIHRDIALLRQTLQRAVLEVSVSAKSRGISQRTALIEYMIGNKAELDFVFHDRHARKWASKKFVRGMWRHTLLAVYNEVVMLTLADHGVTRAQVHHQDASAQAHGMMIALSSNADLPTYSEIRNEIFHPNANAVLAREIADV